ncbi:MAG: MtrB/PioB family decaheme-associated outer membrane protein [Pseudolabrys sp.]|jgi:MtrB/PioB family decaheme-associated outer membrane protein
MKKVIVLSTVAGSLLLAATILPVTAGDVAAPASSMSVADTWWVFHGEVEAGGRFFLNDPQKTGIKSQNGQALGKYYEYSDIKPGPFGQFWLNGQTKDGLYNFNVWGDNVGYNDQRYEADVSKAGEHYFDVIWDQTPHVYSTNALTLYSGIGGPALVLPPGLSNTLFGPLGAGCTRVLNAAPTGCGSPLGAAAANLVNGVINNNLYTTDIGIRRDTAAVAYRWTPTDAWDFNFSYMNMHRWGSQVEGVVFSPGTSGVAAQVPKPVNDTTQNFGVNGEYKGTSPWGKSFTFKVGYAGSIYEDAMSAYTVQNPFCSSLSGPGVGAGVGECARTGSSSSPFALMTLWPNNSSHGVNSTIGADLPWKSRYMGTIAYTWMRQNDAFIPSPYTQLYNGTVGLVAAPGLPASSLNGAINTLLSNNVVTTQITPELKSKLVYRYYDFANNTPELFFNNWTLTDVRLAGNVASPPSVTVTYAPVSSLSVSYNKQNAGAELVWSPNREWNLGTSYGWERYNWTRADANVTNENAGKVFADYKPWSWLLARASYSLSDRQYDNYDYRGYVGNFQWSNPNCTAAAPVGCNVQYSQAMRQFYLDNRQRQIGKFQVAIDVLRGLTVTPTFGYQDDNYSISATEAGLTRLQSIKSGVEVAYAISPGTNILFAYMNENYRQNLKFTTAANVQPMTPANTWNADVKDNVNTIMAAANWAAIPEKLDLRLAYTIAISNTDQPLFANNGTQPSAATGGQFPNISGQWSRLEAQAKYTFDKSSVRMFGINGEAYARLRYVWERNSVNNLDQDIMQAYMQPIINTTGYMTWMAFDNPNYNTHLIGASLGVKW